MEDTDREYFRVVLIHQLKTLLGQADGTVSQLKDSGNSLSDPNDRASFEWDLSFMLRIRDRESRLIRKIVDALDRIEDGTYGICESCGGDIALGRLQARPVTTLCIACKTAQENYEKAAGI